MTSNIDGNTPKPNNTAVRTALWRALHLQVDAAPHVLEDKIGLKLIDPPKGWQDQPDMKYTQRLRASVVARSRFIEDLVLEQIEMGISQYVLLGAGLDTFAQRRQDVASNLEVFEIDEPATVQWKKKRLAELKLGTPDYLHFVPVDFEVSSWWEQLLQSGFKPTERSVLSCTGVTLYLTREAIMETLRQIASLGTGSKLAMSFYLPKEILEDQDRAMQEIAEKGARQAGTPMISFFTDEEILAMGREAGFKEVKTISTKDMERLYFNHRNDNLRPASGEVFLLATT